MFRFFLFLCIFVASLQAKILNTTTLTLKNGLQVVLVQNKMAPVVSVGVLYNVGTADDPATEVGLSHFLEHMMFKGTRRFKENAYAENIKKLGGSHNAYTSYDLTHYISDVPIEGLPLVLDMEADRMINLNFDNEKHLIPEQKVVHQERLMRMENSPFSEAIEAYLKACYWYSPYGVPPIGYPHHIDAYTHKSVMDHYKKWYTPNNASLIIVGDISEKETTELVKKYFDPIKPRSKPVRKRPQEPGHNGVTISLSQENKRSANTIIYYSYRIPAFYKMLDNEFEALLIFEHIFGSSSTSPLYKELIIEKKLALDLGVSGVDYAIDDTYININATLSPDQCLRTFQQNLTPTLRAFIKKTLSEEHITQAKKEIINSKIFIKDNRAGIRSLFDALSYGVSVNNIITSDERLNTVTLQQVKDVYKKYLDKKPDITLHLHSPKNKKLNTELTQKKQETSFFHRVKSLFIKGS
ncbi:MAG TPA: hypothetical protein DIC42_04170 [Holosporales bacterium]|nr:hypothetical protein [Holosporales bacterium]